MLGRPPKKPTPRHAESLELDATHTPVTTMDAVAMSSDKPGTAADSLDADAFRKLYPQAYHQRFLDDGIRHNGRTIGRARETSITVGTIISAEGSSLVKQGETTVLAGVRLTIERPADSSPDRGAVTLNINIASFSAAELGQGRSSDLAASLYDFLHLILLGGHTPSATPGLFPLQQLCIAEGKACWSLSLDLYVLNMDGAVQDAALLAAVSALLNTQLPATVVTPEGDIRRRRRGQPDAMDCSTTPAAQPAGAGAAQAVVLPRVPLALTSGLYKGLALVDPDAEEERLAASLVTIVLDQHNTLCEVYKPGGEPAPQSELLRCVESSKMRYKEVAELLQQALEQAAGAAAAEGAEEEAS